MPWLGGGVKPGFSLVMSRVDIGRSLSFRHRGEERGAPLSSTRQSLRRPVRTSGTFEPFAIAYGRYEMKSAITIPTLRILTVTVRIIRKTKPARKGPVLFYSKVICTDLSTSLISMGRAVVLKPYCFISSSNWITSPTRMFFQSTSFC